MTVELCERPEVGQVRWLDEENTELSLLLPGWQAAELESLARARHLTLGQLIRLLVRDFLAHPTSTRTASERRTHGDPHGGWWVKINHGGTVFEKN